MDISLLTNNIFPKNWQHIFKQLAIYLPPFSPPLSSQSNLLIWFSIYLWQENFFNIKKNNFNSNSKMHIFYDQIIFVYYIVNISYILISTITSTTTSTMTSTPIRITTSTLTKTNQFILTNIATSTSTNTLTSIFSETPISITSITSTTINTTISIKTSTMTSLIINTN